MTAAAIDRLALRPTFSGGTEWMPETIGFPWDLQLPPCQRRISSFTELEDCMNAVPVLNEAYKLTYYPWSREPERPSDPHRLLEAFMDEYNRVNIFYFGRLRELGLPRRLGWALDWTVGITNTRGITFLMTLYFAYADIYRRTDKRAMEDEIVEAFLRVIGHGFPACKERCSRCMVDKENRWMRTTKRTTE
jgi:hypothetical protein